MLAAMVFQAVAASADPGGAAARARACWSIRSVRLCGGLAPGTVSTSRSTASCRSTAWASILSSAVVRSVCSGST